MPKALSPAGWPAGPYLPAIALSLLTLIGALAASARPPATGPVAAVFPPWWSAARTVAAASASGPVIRLGSLPFVVIVAPANARDRALLHHAGALLLIDPIMVSGCLRASAQELQ
jgi:hypothetical protein